MKKRYLIVLIFAVLLCITAVSAHDNQTSDSVLSQNTDSDVKLEKTYYYPNSKDRFVDKSVVTSNVVKYYGDSDRKFKVAVSDKDKNPKSGVEVSLIKSGKYVKKTTNSKGVVYFPLNYKPGTYEVETYIEGDEGFWSAFNTVKVKSTIPVKELVRYSTSKKKFQIKFLDTKGNVLKNKPVKVKIKGKIYNLKTDSLGIVKIKSTRFKVGSEIVAYNSVSGETRKIPVFVLKKGLHKINIRIDDPTSFYPTKKLKNGDKIISIYESKNGRQYPPGVYIHAIYKNDLTSAKHTKVLTAKFFFKNKKTGKIITKTSSNVEYNGIVIDTIKGYSPYKATVWYKDK